MKTLVIYALEVLACSGRAAGPPTPSCSTGACGSAGAEPTCSHRLSWRRSSRCCASPSCRARCRGRPDGRPARDRMDRRSGRRGGSGHHARNGVPDGVPDRGRTGRGGHAVAGRAHPPAAARRGDHPHRAFHARAHPAADRVVLVLPFDLRLGPDPGRRVAGHRGPRGEPRRPPPLRRACGNGVHEGRAVVEPLRMARPHGGSPRPRSSKPTATCWPKGTTSNIT